MNGNNVIYFSSFGVKHIARKCKIFLENKNITNIYRIQAYTSITCGYFFIGFIDFMLKDKGFITLYKFIFS